MTNRILIQKELETLADPGTAAALQWFFKTGPGEYGEGDVFRGIRIPALRKLAKKYKNIPVAEAKGLLKSRFHEDRMLALLILVWIYSNAGAREREKIFNLYLGHTRFINNWDLVDSSAPYIVGPFLSDKGRAPLYTLARSARLWERRISIISTFHFIRQNQFADTLRLAEMLLPDKHDLIHKATGWMLREVGQRDREAEEQFLRAHCRQMPRTMLRYAIEHFSEGERRHYMRRD